MVRAPSVAGFWLVLGAAAIVILQPPPRGVAQEKPGEPRDDAPLIRDVMSIDKTVKGKGQVQLHFTPEQWKAATKDVIEVKELAKERVVLEAVPMPGREGHMLVGVRCPKGCSTIFEVREPQAAKGAELRPPPDTFIVPNCDCSMVQPEVKGVGDPPVPPCRLVIRRHQPGKTIKAGQPSVLFVCEAGTCTRQCRLGSVRLPNGTFYIGCFCE